MRKSLFLLTASCLMTGAAFAADAPALDVQLMGIVPGAPIPPHYALCQPDAKTHTKDGGNVSPAIRWSGAPAGTKSYLVTMHDTDVPKEFGDANKEGKTIAADAPRLEKFHHWLLADIAAEATGLPEGADSQKVEWAGKPAQKTDFGVRGINDIGSKKGGTFAGYDGPCPPWNDARLHHYHFRVHALDVPTLGLAPGFTPAQAEAAMKGHVLASGESMGTYTQNTALLD